MNGESDLPETSRTETIHREYKHGRLTHEQVTTVTTRGTTEDDLPIGLYL